VQIEHAACSYPSAENCRALYELATSLGVPATASLTAAQDRAWVAMSTHGFAATHYTGAHTAMQYAFLTAIIKETEATAR